MKPLQIFIAVAIVALAVQLAISYNKYTEIIKHIKIIYDYLNTKLLQ